MAIGIIGKKLGNTSVYDENGRRLCVTVLRVGPCYVTAKRTLETDGYSALQIGFDEVAEKKLNKPRLGHLKKAQAPPLRLLREFRAAPGDIGDLAVGQKLTVELFQKAPLVDVTAKSIGKGFQGVVRRHGFHGGAATHGSMSHRAPGSIGGTTRLSRVLKGKRMAGHMGNVRVTTHHLQVVKIIPEQNLLLVKGAVPGAKNGTVIVRMPAR